MGCIVWWGVICGGVYHVMGLTSGYICTCISRHSCLHTHGTYVHKHIMHTQPKPWKEVFPAANPLALQLMDSMLQFDPARRITVEQALAHPYLAALHDVATEPSAVGRGYWIVLFLTVLFLC